MVVFSLNMFSDALRDLLDPRLRGGEGSYGARKRKRGFLHRAFPVHRRLGYQHVRRLAERPARPQPERRCGSVLLWLVSVFFLFFKIALNLFLRNPFEDLIGRKPFQAIIGRKPFQAIIDWKHT